MKLILKGSEFAEKLASHAGFADKMRIQAHLLACSALGECDRRNPNWADDLAALLANKKHFPKVKFVEWVHAHSPMRYSFRDKKFSYSPAAKNQEYSHEAAQATPFFDSEAGTPAKKLKTEQTAVNAFALAMARRILCDKSSLEDFNEYPKLITAAIAAALGKQSAQDWADAYFAQGADNI